MPKYLKKYAVCIRNANDDQKIIGNIDSFFGEKRMLEAI